MRGNMRFFPLLAVTIAAACTTGERHEAATDTTAAPTAGGPVNEITIRASDYAFDAPETIPAGLTEMKLVDVGKEMHHATLIKLDSGKTFDDLMAALKEMKPGTQPPGWLIPAGGPNAVAPDGVTALKMVLEPGNYAFVCFIPDAKGVPHFAHGMIKSLTVTPNPNANMSEPESDVTVTLSDYKFDFSKPLVKGEQTVKLVTAPGQPHEFTLFRLEPGKKAEDILKYLESGMNGPPPGMPVGGVAAVAAGRASYYDVELHPGEYAIVCFLDDAGDGKPHFAHGMIQQFTIN